MPFPSTLSSFNYPSATSRLNNPSHSALHNTVASALGQVETIIGTSASTLGTIIGDLRNPLSGGGGHVQTAILGGTGQTTFTKGDVLVAQSSSVLSKLAAGTDNQVLTGDSTQTIGVKWASPTRIAAIASIQTVSASSTETSILSVTIPASVLSTGNVIRATAFVGAYTGTDTLLIKANYGANQVASILLSPSAASTSSVAGKIEYVLHANAAANVQRGVLAIDLKASRLNILQSSVLGIDGYKMGTSSINSAANQTLGLTAKWSGTTAGNRIDIDSYIVEKIL